MVLEPGSQVEYYIAQNTTGKGKGSKKLGCEREKMKRRFRIIVAAMTIINAGGGDDGAGDGRECSSESC